jgi:hypothetical protein
MHALLVAVAVVAKIQVAVVERVVIVTDQVSALVHHLQSQSVQVVQVVHHQHKQKVQAEATQYFRQSHVQVAVVAVMVFHLTRPIQY